MRTKYEKAKIFLQTVINETPDLISNELTRQIGAKKVKLMDAKIYIRKRLTSTAGVQNLLEDQIQKTNGVNLFDGKSLGNNRYFVANSMSIKAVIDDSTKTVQNVDYSVSLPSGLKNSLIMTKQQGKVLVDLPISAVADARNTDAFVLEFENPVLLRGDNIDIEQLIDFPGGIDLGISADKSLFVEVEYGGFVSSVQN